jgi:hypothetical protein
MRSRLEASFAAYLDRHQWDWEYEPACFAGSAGQWLPDFLRRAGESVEYIELKPAARFLPLAHGALSAAETINPILARMAVVWETDPDARLELVFWEYGARQPRMTISGQGTHKRPKHIKRQWPFPYVWEARIWPVTGGMPLVWPGPRVTADGEPAEHEPGEAEPGEPAD